MDRNIIKYVINVGLLIASSSIFITGLIKFPGLLHYFGIEIKLLPLSEINTIHEWSGIILIYFVLMHLLFNWQWFVSMTKRIFGMKK